MTRLVVATRSGHKAAEIDRILRPLGLGLVTLPDLDVDPDPAEDDLEVHDTFRENAAAKARWFARRLQRPVLADDSGLCVDALGGRPGVHTKRFSGRADLTGDELDRANNLHLLERLARVPGPERTARYVCCAALAWPDGRAVAAIGTVAGRITDAPAGDGGFGYDPLFEVAGLGVRFSEVPAATKAAISHRARAFRAMASGLASPPFPLL